MNLLLKIKAPDESAWLALYRAHFAEQVAGEWRAKPGVSNVVLLGVFRHTTGNTVTVTGPGGQPMQVPEQIDAPTPGYHVDLIADDVPEAVQQYLVNPVNPRHVYAGNHVLAMPEELVEAEETVMLTRGIGQKFKDEELAKLELEKLKSKLTLDVSKKRKQIIEASIAICEARINIKELKDQKEQAVKDVKDLKGVAKDNARELYDSLTLEIDTAQSEIESMRKAKETLKGK